MSCSRAMRAAAIMPSTPRSPKPPGTTMPSSWRDPLGVDLGGDPFGLQPLDLGLGAYREAGVTDRLAHREVGVGHRDVLADDPDAERLGRAVDPAHDVAPRAQVDRVASRSMPSVLHTIVSSPSSYIVMGMS